SAPRTASSVAASSPTRLSAAALRWPLRPSWTGPWFPVARIMLAASSRAFPRLSARFKTRVRFKRPRVKAKAFGHALHLAPRSENDAKSRKYGDNSRDRGYGHFMLFGGVHVQRAQIHDPLGFGERHVLEHEAK